MTTPDVTAPKAALTELLTNVHGNAGVAIGEAIETLICTHLAQVASQLLASSSD